MFEFIGVRRLIGSYFLLQGHLESNEGDPELLVYIP